MENEKHRLRRNNPDRRAKDRLGTIYLKEFSRDRRSDQNDREHQKEEMESVKQEEHPWGKTCENFTIKRGLEGSLGEWEKA